MNDRPDVHDTVFSILKTVWDEDRLEARVLTGQYLSFIVLFSDMEVI